MPNLGLPSKASVGALLLGAGLVGIGMPNSAHAILLFATEVGATTLLITDNGVGDNDPDTGSIALGDRLIGGLRVRGSVHTSDKATGPGDLNVLNSSSVTVRNTTNATINATVVVSDTDFLGPSFEATTSGSGTFERAQGSSISMFWYNDPNNAQGGESILDTPGQLIDTFSFTSPDVAESFAHNGGPFDVNDPALFSMTLKFDLSLVGGGRLISRGQTELKEAEAVAVPEPGTLGILGFGLAGLAIAIGRRGLRI